MKGRHHPCLAHVLQLALRDLLSTVKAKPTNDSDVETWSDDMALSLHTYFGVGAVLQKVCIMNAMTNYITTIITNTLSCRYGSLLDMSTPAHNA